MKNRETTLGALILITGALIWLSTGCGSVQDNKIPTTTSSSEALDYYVQGRDLAEKLQAQESIQHFEKAVAADPAFAMAYLNLALAAPTTKGFFEYLDKAVALVDRVTEGERLQILGIRAIAEADPMRQMDFYQRLVESYPGDERAHHLLGNSLFDQEEYDRAIPEYLAASHIAPDYARPYNQLGYAYKYLGNLSEAQNAFRRYIDLIPDDPNPYDSYAELLMKMGRYDASIEQYRKALSINPNFVASHVGMATNYNLKGEHAKAREQLQTLYEIARDDGERREALFAMAVSYIDEGHMDRAMEELRKMYAVAEGIDDASSMSSDLITLGTCLCESGRLDEALASFERAREVMMASDLSAEVKDNAQQTYLYNAARIDIRKKKFTAAHTKAEAYLARATTRENIIQIRQGHELAAMIALAKEQYDQALAELGQSSRQNPYNLYRMALAYEAKGEQELAQKCFRKAAQFNALNDINYAFIRNKAAQGMAEL